MLLTDECRLSKPCKNGATCTDQAGSYSCKCTSCILWQKLQHRSEHDPLIEIGLDYGEHKNYGGNTEFCKKKIIYVLDVNECWDNPCKNGAICVNLKGSYRCNCKSGYTGKDCGTGMGLSISLSTFFGAISPLFLEDLYLDLQNTKLLNGMALLTLYESLDY